MNNVSVRALVVASMCALALGVVIGISWPQLPKSFSTPPSLEDVADDVTHEPKVLYWYDPMVPDQHFDKPGPSPFMDMDLVPKYATQSSQEPGLAIDANLVQNLGMRTAKVEPKDLTTHVEVTGVLLFNERSQAVVQLRASGFAEKVWPLAVGDSVIAGQPIAEFQIPEWLDVQNDMLSQPVTENPRLLQTLRTRLQLLGMPDELIAKVEKTRQPETRVTITAPISGVVTLLGIKTGMAMASGDTLVQINGIDSVWLDAAIPEAQASLLTSGAKATFYPANPDDVALYGTLEYLLPIVDEKSRTLTARVLFDNPNRQLKPGTSGRVTLQTTSDKTGLFVPTEAIIRTGKRVLVMVAESSGTFRPVEVIAGQEIGNQTHIKKGLEVDQEVVTSGQFLLDSEASLLGIPSVKLHSHTLEMNHD
ncbi:efflux RND transporter periplasmic adaptor subunit [Cellvibrio sp. NN19]|uniref:efflux RND transporter periplasmic adaptor subunit n=1 Tax=Cellvibrio chitinivorans TaxID=3102792 RepID=UPI002B40DADB|nr:efflux RND transporter periplasmic adaptor subunit [Cellvibrio sp. NN19]